MKTDERLKSDVMEELAWDPAVNATAIGVAVSSGVVTLTGHLDTYAEKHAVERAVQRVGGVRGIALELDVKLAPDHRRSDSEIAQAATTALQLNALLPVEGIRVEVEDGHITLRGEVDWSYQLASAEHSVRPLAGVRGVSNRITLKPRASSKDVAAQISAALARQAAREAGHLSVDVADGVVTLRGTVHSMAERKAAVGAAFSARGVSRVVDRLEVGA